MRFSFKKIGVDVLVNNIPWTVTLRMRMFFSFFLFCGLLFCLLFWKSALQTDTLGSVRPQNFWNKNNNQKYEELIHPFLANVWGVINFVCFACLF